MAVAPVYTQGWTLDDVSWELFSPSDVDPTIKVVRIDGRSPEDKDYELRLQPRPGTK